MSITVRIATFECYNQPLDDDPDTADLIGAAMVAMMTGQDFMDHAKLTILAVLGRKDIHKFQNMIEDGRAPSFDFPDTRLTLSVEPTTSHTSHIPAGGTPIVVREGHLQILDWVNYWMFENSPYSYRPCPYEPTMDQPDYNDGLANSYIIGVVYNGDKTGYHVAVAVEIGGENPVLETRIVEDVTIPLVPDGVHSAVYYSLGKMEQIEEATGEGEDSSGSESGSEAAVCQGISDPGQRVDGAGGFVWKPVSEKNGRAVVLFPAGSPSGAASIQGIETGEYNGLTNGGRPTTYFSKTGSAYAGPIIVCSGTGGAGGGSIGGDEVEMCGVLLLDSGTDISFGEESGDLITFPPIPVRADNENYYSKFDEGKQHDIERLSRLFEIRPDRLIDDIMESEDVVGNEEKVDDVYINFGSRIHDNSKATCRYLYLFFGHIMEMVNSVGNGFSNRCDENNLLFGLGAATESGVSCNLMSVRSGSYYYEFGFTYVEEGSAGLSEILGDENLAEQYEDRRKTTKPWYLSSSEGDGSAGEEYEQPSSGEEYLEALLAGEGSSEHHITFYECWPDGHINTLTVYGFSGRMRIEDELTGVVRTIQMNPEDPNSILVPYVPAIGEVLTNHELADCFLSGLHISIMVADITVKAIPWWVVAIIIIIVIAIAWTGYGGTLAQITTQMIMEMILVMFIGYMIAAIVTEIGGTTAGIIGAVLMVVVFIATKGMGTAGFFTNLQTSFAAMSLPQILMATVNLLSKLVSTVVGATTIGIGQELEEGEEDYSDRMALLREEQSDYLDSLGSQVEIEPLLDDLINTSIRTEINPMSPDAFYGMMDKFHEIGTSLYDTDYMFEDPFNMDNMLQPA